MPDMRAREQGFRRRKIFCALLFVALIALPLGACGKKPGKVDPPPTVTEDSFPQVYPDPSTDPKP